MTIEQSEGGERYQGVVPLVTARLADCLEQYFERSEQLPSRLMLAATPDRAAGLLLQRVAMGESGTVTERAEADDAWRRLGLLAATISPKELFDLPSRKLLRRLFPEDDIRLFEGAPVFFQCTCSRERVAGILQSLGGAGGARTPRRARRRGSALRILQPRLALRRGRRRRALFARRAATGAARIALTGLFVRDRHSHHKCMAA